MPDITSVRLLYIKGGLFLALGGLASFLLLVEAPSAKVAMLLGIAVWSFARAYYFAFHVIEHYVDPTFKFSGLSAFLRYVIGRRKD